MCQCFCHLSFCRSIKFLIRHLVGKSYRKTNNLAKSRTYYGYHPADAPRLPETPRLPAAQPEQPPRVPHRSHSRTVTLTHAAARGGISPATLTAIGSRRPIYQPHAAASVTVAQPASLPAFNMHAVPAVANSSGGSAMPPYLPPPPYRYHHHAAGLSLIHAACCTNNYLN